MQVANFVFDTPHTYEKQIPNEMRFFKTGHTKNFQKSNNKILRGTTPHLPLLRTPKFSKKENTQNVCCDIHLPFHTNLKFSRTPNTKKNSQVYFCTPTSSEKPTFSETQKLPLRMF